VHRELELNELVKRLDDLDAEDNTERKYRLQSVDHEEGWDPTQKNLINQLEDKLSKYCENSRLGNYLDGGCIHTDHKQMTFS
jgi:hypothetical protein